MVRVLKGITFDFRIPAYTLKIKKVRNNEY